MERIECIALRTVKYNDKHNILGVYSRQYGRMSLLLPATGGRGAMRMRALAMPLSRFECVADIKPGRDIVPIRDMRVMGQHPSVNPLKGALSLFIADMLQATLNEQQQDQRLYAFLSQAIDDLAIAGMDGVANFHIIFMLRLTHFLGIEPDWSTYKAGAVFDMVDGIFRMSPPMHRYVLTSAEAQAAVTLSRMNKRTARLYKLSRADRNIIIDRILDFYRIHFPGIRTINSIDVLRTLFDF